MAELKFVLDKNERKMMLEHINAIIHLERDMYKKEMSNNINRGVR